jgi:flavin-dependent thymidylate synthase
MNVELLSYTPDALNLLLRTKGTRLAHTDDPAAWTPEAKQQHLDYMRDTIKSSWEFVDYTFRISEVTRAFTHQLVRTRAGSYAQESQRTVDVRDHQWNPLRSGDYTQKAVHDEYMRDAIDAYAAEVDEGIPVQDARELLPTGIHTSIIAKFDLRTLSHMAEVRLCVRTQGEYQEVFRAMKARVVGVHDWAEPFIRVGCALDGICRFPRYTACPIQPLTYNARPEHQQAVATIAEAAERIRHEATPVARAGKTM